MNLSSLLKSTGLLAAIAFAGQANASFMGSFGGTMSAVTPWDTTVNGNLAADLSADPNAPFNLGTIFSGSFSYNVAGTDNNPSSSVGYYASSLLSFSITGGDINSSTNKGDVRIADNEVVGTKVRDHYKLHAMNINDTFVINGNTWILNTAHIILDYTSDTASSIFDSDSLLQEITDTTVWKWEMAMLKFTLQGVANSEHYARIGNGQPDKLTFEVLSFPEPDLSAAVPATATLPLMMVGLGLLGMRRRR